MEQSGGFTPRTLVGYFDKSEVQTVPLRDFSGV